MLGFQRRSTVIQRPGHRGAARASTLAILAALAFGAPTAQAATTHLTYQCDYPFIGNTPLGVDVTTSFPAAANAGVLLPNSPVQVVATDQGEFADWVQLVYGTQVVGTAVLSVPTSVPGIASFPVVKVPLAAPVTPYAPPSTRTLTFQGAYPPVKFPQPGIVTYAADKLDLLLTIERADGTPVPMSQDVPETDTDPNTFDVPCTLAPPTQSTGLGSTIVSGADTAKPTAPGQPAVSEVTATSARLTWPASTDNVGVTGYDVYRDTTKVASTTDTTTVISGLSPGTTTAFTVVAHDGAGNTSASSPPAVVNTLYTRPALNLTLACTAPLVGSTPFSATLQTNQPTSVPAGRRAGFPSWTLSLTTSTAFSELLDTVSAASLEGRGLAPMRLVGPGINRAILAPYSLTKLALAGSDAGPYVLAGRGSLPSMIYQSKGAGFITVQGIDLNLIARDSTGTPLRMPVPSGQTDSDDDPDTFDVHCVIDPDSQTALLASFQVT